MIKTILYTYLGTNGTLTTPIHLPGVYCVKKYDLIADEGKKLTKNGTDLHKFVTVAEAEVEKWYEVDVE